MVELLPGVVRSAAVERSRISQQIEMRLNVCQATGEVVFDTGETADQLVALPRYLVEPSLDLCNRQLAVCCEIQQVLFLDVELINLGLELLAEEALGADFVSNNCFELPADSLDEHGLGADH